MIENSSLTANVSRRPNGLNSVDGRLDSWKEIASFFGKEVRTVQLWEKRENLPVHRHFHLKLGNVFAYRSELEVWKQKASGHDGEVQAETIRPSVRIDNSRDRAAIHVQPIQSKPDSIHHSLCDAITARTVSSLAQIYPSTVVAGPALLRADSGGSPQDLPKKPTSGYILKWALQEARGSLSFTAELVSVDSRLAVWSHLYQFLPGDYDRMPVYLAEQIVSCIGLAVNPSPEGLRRAIGRPRTAAARSLYLKGRYFWEQRSEESLRKAIRYFEAAIEEDPLFAPSYSGIADSHNLLAFYEIVPPARAIPQARRAAQRAIEIDPGLAEGHASLGDILFHFDRDWQGADREYRSAIRCNPDYAIGYQWYANLLSAKGLHDAAQMAITRAIEINPVSLSTLVRAGVISYLAHRYDDAIRHYQSALELDPDFIWAHMNLALALEEKGHFREAVREFETTIKLANGNNCVLAMEAHAHAIAGDRSSARRILDRITTATDPKCMPSYDIAATYAALGDSRQMGIWLSRACTERNMKVFTLIQDPRFEPLRHHTEFTDIAERVGLAQYNSSSAAILTVRPKAQFLSAR